MGHFCSLKALAPQHLSKLWVINWGWNLAKLQLSSWKARVKVLGSRLQHFLPVVTSCHQFAPVVTSCDDQLMYSQYGAPRPTATNISSSDSKRIKYWEVVQCRRAIGWTWKVHPTSCDQLWPVATSLHQLPPVCTSCDDQFAPVDVFRRTELQTGGNKKNLTPFGRN